MGDYDLRVLLEDRGYGDCRYVVLDEIERAAAVAVDAEVDRACCQHLSSVELRSTLADRDVEAVPCVNPGGQRLVEAAMFGFGDPAHDDADLVAGSRRRRAEQCGDRHRPQ